VWWRELGQVDSEYISHILRFFAIILQKLSKLVKIWRSSDKNNFAQFFRHGVVHSTLCLSNVMHFIGQTMRQCFLRLHHNGLTAQFSDNVFKVQLLSETSRNSSLLSYHWTTQQQKPERVTSSVSEHHSSISLHILQNAPINYRPFQLVHGQQCRFRAAFD